MAVALRNHKAAASTECTVLAARPEVGHTAIIEFLGPTSEPAERTCMPVDLLGLTAAAEAFLLRLPV